MELGTLEKLVKFLDQSLIGIIVLDNDLTIKFVNSNYDVFFLNTFGVKLQKNMTLTSQNCPQKFIDIWVDVLKGESFYDENHNFYGNVTNHDGVIVGGYSINSGIYDKSALKKLIKIADAKNTVLERANHELRTPLVSIVGSAQLLDLCIPRTKEYDQYREHIKCILESSEHLKSMIEEFMDFSRISSKKLILDNSGFINVPAIIQRCVDIVKPQAEQYNTTITSIGMDTKCTIKGDKNRFSQILINLLSNAIKYNKPNGKVVTECKVNGPHVQIDIVDTGVGMDQDDIKNKLFKEYVRFGPKCDKVEGSGLGLALSKKLIDLMHGKIFVKSKLGVGTRFSVVFKSANNVEDIEENCMYIVYLDPDLTYHRIINNMLSARFDRQPRVLVAMSTEIAEKLIKQYNPSLIIVDEKVTDFQSQLPTIVLGDGREAKNSKLVRVLNKPFEMEDFLSAVNDMTK